jgi:hypothetical protein
MMALRLATSHLSDAEFLEALHSCRLPGEQFANADHFRLAWLHLHGHSPAEAEDLVRSAIRTFGAHHGRLDKYHETITLAWVRLIATHTESTFEQFLRVNEARLNPEMLHRFWTPELLASEAARLTWVPPDRAELPGANA